MKLKSVQFPKHGMTEFRYHGTSIKKHRQYASFVLSHRFTASRSPWNPKCLGMSKFPWHENILWKIIWFTDVGFFWNRKLLGSPNNPQSMNQVKYHAMGISSKELPYSHTLIFDWKFVELGYPHIFQVWENSSQRSANAWGYFFQVHGK